MIDLVEAGRIAAFNALKAKVADVRDFVKQDTQPPFTMLGDIEFANEGSKSEPLLAVSIEVISVYRGGDRAELTARMHGAFEALNDQPLAAPGAEISSARLSAGAVSNAGPDGVTMVGVQTFEFMIEPA